MFPPSSCGAMMVRGENTKEGTSLLIRMRASLSKYASAAIVATLMLCLAAWLPIAAAEPAELSVGSQPTSGLAMCVVPAGTVSDRTRVEIRVGLENSGAVPLPQALQFYLDTPSRLCQPLSGIIRSGEASDRHRTQIRAGSDRLRLAPLLPRSCLPGRQN